MSEDVQIKQLSQGACCFGMEMGTGKTFSAIALAEMLFLNKHIKSVLVICPLSLVASWAEQLKLYSTCSIWTEIVGTKSQKEKALTRLSFTALLGAGKDKLRFGITNPDGLSSIKDKLKEKVFHMIIIDESTLIKNHTTQRAKIIVELFNNAPYKLILSGNIIPKSPVEIFGQYLFLSPDIFGTNFYQFRDKYFNIDFFNSVTGFKTKTLEEEFTQKMHSVMFCKKKIECLDLPPQIYEKLYLQMEPEQEELYKKMRNEALLYYNDKRCSAPVVITKILRMSQITGGTIPSDDKTVQYLPKNPKLEALVELLENLGEATQVVVWARFRSEIRLIIQRLEKEKISCCSFYGETSLEERKNAGILFEAKKIRVFVGNPATGGKGINFLRHCNNVIYFSNDYSAENREQSENRTHRAGSSGEKVLYVDLLMQNTIDEVILDVLRSNRDVSEAILGRKIVF